MSTERRIAAIMFTDVVGYSALSQENEELALELLEEHFALLRPVIFDHGGNEIKTMGDSFLVEFSSPLQAVKCAIEFQRLLLKRNLDQPQERHVTIRIGIHLGDVEHRSGDVFGDGVNIASRIESLADPGGIAVTRQVYDQVHNKIDFELKRLGTPQLKNITTVVEIYKVDLKWDSSGYALPTRKIHSKRDQMLKFGSVVAVAVIVIVAAFAIWRSVSIETSIELEPGEINSIAVIPFENLSSDPENEYFTDGLAEEMRNALAKIDGLRVPSYTSSSSGNLDDLSLKEIANLLNVQAILEGTVRKSGDQLRITAQFIRASDDSHVWSETFDREMGDIFEIQEEIAQAIVQKLGYKTNNRKIVKSGTENTEAYNLYLHGQFQLGKRSDEGFFKAIEYFEQALALDPDYAQAYTGLSGVYSAATDYGFLPIDEARAKAVEYANAALEIDENMAEPFAHLGWIELFPSYHIAKAEEYFLKSIELDPSYPSVHHWYRILLSIVGRDDEALDQIRLAYELDPLSAIILQNLAEQYRILGRYDEAISTIETLFEINPDFSGGFRELGQIYQFQGDWEKAEEIHREGLKRIPENSGLNAWYGLHNRYLGRFDEAERVLQKAIEISPNWITAKVLMGRNLIFAKRYDEAKSYLADALLLDEQVPFTLYEVALAHYFTEDFELGYQAIELAFQMIDSSNTTWRRRFLALEAVFHAHLGDRVKAEHSIGILMQEDLFHKRLSPNDLAYVYAALGDSDNVIRWLNEGIEQHFGYRDLKVDPIYDPYRDDPRFQELLAKMGLNDQ